MSKKPNIKSKLFPNENDMYDRFLELETNDPFIKKREQYLRNYNRRDWKRTSDPTCNKKEPNYGQFKFKMDAAMGVFVNVLTERNAWIKIFPKYPEPGQSMKRFSDQVTSSFHKYFIRPWEDRYMMEITASFDMVFYGKAIEYWPTPGCIYTENIPVENVYPDSNAGLDTKKWSYVFIRKEFTVAELIAILENTSEEEKDILEEFDKTYLREILENIETYSGNKDNTEANKEKSGDQSDSAKDNLIPIVYAYVKDNFGRDQKKVSLYAFPARIQKYGEEDPITKKKNGIQLLMRKPEYCDCISNVIACRAYQITKSYWKFASLAQQIFLATALYDKSTNLVLRAAKRKSILYLSSDSPDTQKKLLKQSDEEVQVVDSNVTFQQIGAQNNNIREVMEVMRGIMVDTENGQSISQAPGSQNVKGYAITAEEAKLRAQKEGENESISIRVLMNQDVKLYKEIYRRAMDSDSEHGKKALAKFKKEMEMFNVPDDCWKYDDVYFMPAFLNGGSQYSRLANANGILDALRQAPTSPGQEQAQRDVIAALAGVDNVDTYITERLEVNPVVTKAGQENEDLDNPNVNPMNVQVLPDDKHLQEIPVHVADYQYKLELAQRIIQTTMQMPNKFRQLILLQAASDLIAAQDEKGKHISAHIQAAATSKENMNVLKPILDEFGAMQAMQDKMTKEILQLTENIDKSMVQSAVQDVELDHKKKMYDLEETHQTNVNSIALGKAISQSEMSKERSAEKIEEDKQKTITDMAVKQAQGEQKIDLTQQQNEAKLAGQTNKQSGITGTQRPTEG